MPAAETLKLQRSCLAVAVPSGQQVVLVEAAAVELVQALGGSFTVKVQGRLFRIDGKHADALGKEPVLSSPLKDNATSDDVEALVWERLRTCFDPEIPVNIVDLGLVYRCRVLEVADGTRHVEIKMTLTAPACGMGRTLVADVRQRVLEVPSVQEVRVDLVFDPPWDASRMSDEARLQTGIF